MNTEIFLEVTSGSGVVPLFILTLILINYIIRESYRRIQAGYDVDWISPPPHIDFALAVLTLVVGVLINATVVWAWRRFFGGIDFNMLQKVLLGIGRTLTLFGSICIVRALTKPDYGDKPWIIAWAATIMAGVMMIVVR